MFRAIIRIILIIPILSICILLLALARLARKKTWRDNIRQCGFSLLSHIMGLRVQIVGEIAKERPLLLVSNHISYLDIFVLGAKTTACFTPKIEVSRWAVVSTICKLLGCVYIDRRSSKIKDGGNNIRNALEHGEIVSLFPEGTTGNGKHLLPFKSSLFSIVEEKIEEQDIWVQPAIIRYTHISKLPIDTTQWPRIAWYGDMTLAPHFWQMLKFGKIYAKLIFLPAISYSQFGDRKLLAKHLEEAVAEVLSN